MHAIIDLSQAPYSEYVDLLELVRSSRDGRLLVAYEPKAERRGTFDAQQQDRWRLALVLSVSARPDDLGLIRFLLDQEIEARQNDSFQGAGVALDVLSMLVLEHGDGEVEDTLRFWLAKTANFDTVAGGYDIEFVFSQRPVDEVMGVLRTRAPKQTLALLERYNVADIVEHLPGWRRRLRAQHYPRHPSEFVIAHGRMWADVFEDAATTERLGLLEANSAEDRARVYQRIEQFESAWKEWRVAAREATSPWDQASRLRDAMTCATKAMIETLEEARELDSLRANIDSWNDVGLGRMSTQACFELAAVAKNPDVGTELYRLADRWRGELTSFTYVGLQAAVVAARAWGTDEECAELEQLAHQEKVRISAL